MTIKFVQAPPAQKKTWPHFRQKEQYRERLAKEQLQDQKVENNSAFVNIRHLHCVGLYWHPSRNDSYKRLNRSLWNQPAPKINVYQVQKIAQGTKWGTAEVIFIQIIYVGNSEIAMSSTRTPLAKKDHYWSTFTFPTYCLCFWLGAR